MQGELAHYEKRLLKLRKMHVYAMMSEEYKRNSKDPDKSTLPDISEEMIKEQTRKVAKIHLDLESRILSRHSEL